MPRAASGASTAPVTPPTGPNEPAAAESIGVTTEAVATAPEAATPARSTLWAGQAPWELLAIGLLGLLLVGDRAARLRAPRDGAARRSVLS